MKNKVVANLVMFAIIMALVSSLFVSPTIAEDYDPQDTKSGCLVPSIHNVTIGDDFYVTLYIDSGTDSVTSFVVRILEWNTVLGAVNVTNNPGGTPNADWNCSFTSTWKAGGMYDDGDLHNTTGNLTYGPQATVLGGVTGNNSAARINFTALSPGFINIFIPQASPWNPAQSGLDIGAGAADWWRNCSVTVHPQGPTGLTATTYNHTIINITGMARGTGADTVLLCGKTGSYPSNYGDSLLYNGTNSTYNHTNLNNCSSYYYRAWTYNTTTNIYSIANQSATATTSCYTNFSFTGASPTNGSTYTNCTYSVPVNVTVTNNGGHTFSYWVNGSNGQTASGTGQAANSSVGRTLSSLSHNTSYWWNVTVTDTIGDSNEVHYYFTTGIGGGTAPAGSNPGPINGATDEGANSPTFNLTVTDANSDPMEVSFYWTNGSIIGTDSYTPTGGSASTTFGGNLELNTTYYWYALVNDTAGCQSTRVPASGTYSFTTQASAVAIYKEWDVDSNNMITAWVNVTNNGDINLTNIQVNESYHSNITFGGATPVNDSGDSNTWTIPYLNVSGYENHWYNITIYLNLSGRVLNETSVTDTVWAIVNGTNVTASTSALTYCFYATKEYHGSAIPWDGTTINYSINVTNCGNFVLNWVQINETYYHNTSFNDSSITPSLGNETFNITSVLPGATSSMWLLLNINGTNFDNGSSIWNNFTLSTNETSDEITQRVYDTLGARTEAIRIIYKSSLTEVETIGNDVLNILGILIIISAILMIVYIVYRQGLFGGGGEGESGGE